jgi:oxygen-dependent protoporphyrinogen oxidase
LRVLAEPFAKGPTGADETVFDFASRRIGRQAAEVLVDAMVTGIFAGDSRQLELAATFPKMAAMEAQYGSLTKALLAKAREAREQGGRVAGPAGPGGTLTSFRRGMMELPRTLASTLGDRLRLRSEVRSIERSDHGFIVTTSDGLVSAEKVLLATPAAVTARLLQDLAPAAGDPLTGIQSVPIAVVMTAYAAADAFGHPVSGFGFLIPGVESMGALGTLFCHDIFAVHAPTGGLFLRTMLGGARDPAVLELDDDALVERTRAVLSTVLGSDPDPDHAWVVRWSEGISQYTVGHLDRVRRAEAAAAAVGVELAGSPYRGVSVNDCIRSSRAAAGRLAERVGAPSGAS